MTSSHHDDVLDDLGRWIRQNEDTWLADDVERMSDDHMHALAAAVATTSSSRSRRRIVGGAIAVVVLTGSAAAAAVMLSDQPTAPEAGVVCRAELNDSADAAVLEPGTDPLAGCRMLWEEGRLGDISGASEVPDLVACIGSGGAIEVFPGPADGCEQLGLVPAAEELSAENAEVVQLNEQLTEQINAAPCVPVRDVAAAAERIVQQSGLTDWEVVVSPGSEGGTCGKVAVDSAVQQVFVNQL
jgi:hypothetical protein